jgi:hypothetical protein
MRPGDGQAIDTGDTLHQNLFAVRAPRPMNRQRRLPVKAKPTITRQTSSKAAPRKGKGLSDLAIKNKLAASVSGGTSTLFSATTSQQKLKLK